MPELRSTLARLAPCLLVAAQLSAAAPREDLATQVDHTLADFQGSVCFYAKNLDSGESYGRSENDRVRTASTIKLPIMVAVFAAVARGEAAWSETLVLHEADKVTGSGVLQELSDGLRLPLRDLVRLMIVVSDNTATNLLLDRFSSNAVNAEMDKLGLKQTRSLRKILRPVKGAEPKAEGWSCAGRLPESQGFGIGVSTSREMVALLELIARGAVVSRDASEEMIEVLKRQQHKDGIGRRLEHFTVGSKSGALDHLRSDVGIVFTPGGRIAMAVTCDDMPTVDYSADNAGNLLIARLAEILVEGLSK